jgi:hypothetical protein
MNPVERLVDEEVARLMDRLAASVPEGALAAMSAKDGTLRRRLDEVERQMAQARGALIEGYGKWRRVLEDVENLWALAAWRSATEEPAQETPSIAA